MPVLDQTTTNSYTGNGVSTVFAYTFKLLDQGDLLVEIDGVTQTLTTHYSVSGVGTSGGGNVTFVTAPESGAAVDISRDMAFARDTDYQENGDLQAETLDEDIDRVVMLAQQVRDQNNAGSYNFIQAGSGATTRTVQSKLRDVVSVNDFGATGDGITDDLTAFQAAAAASKVVHVPAGTYVLSGTVTISKDGAAWYGDGINASIITSSSASAPIFSINSGLSGLHFEKLQLTRSTAATSGGDAIKSSTVSIGQTKITNCLIQNQYVGLNLGPTDYSLVENVIIQKCISHGLALTNTAVDGACQWSIKHVLAQMNGGDGFHLATIAGPSQMTLGQWQGVYSFANSGRGFSAVGTSGVPINGIRLSNGFFGEDGDSEIYLQTYGSQHMISDSFAELAGTRTTGPSLATAASGVGSGVELGSSNSYVMLDHVHAHGNSKDGFYVGATSQTFTGCRATDNGAAGTAGRRNGINGAAGYVQVVGGQYGNTGAGTSQAYGVFIADGNNLSLGFATLTLNATAGWGATSNIAYAQTIGNLPNTLNVGLSGQGGVTIGAPTNGFANGAGTINVQGGMLKNNAAYLNP